MKLEKVEKERNELRLNTDRLESRVRPFACGSACWVDWVRKQQKIFCRSVQIVLVAVCVMYQLLQSQNVHSVSQFGF